MFWYFLTLIFVMIAGFSILGEKIEKYGKCCKDSDWDEYDQGNFYG